MNRGYATASELRELEFRQRQGQLAEQDYWARLARRQVMYAASEGDPAAKQLDAWFRELETADAYRRSS
jgi:hypothetical protein